ncbi:MULTISPECIES: hypothetical protein [Halorussus]|uniref:hypothetical protein n=1 Tax=Halorussus TaxID=1070314 RepID=UPI0020A03FF0|nr:hypothetical protein [Halorussus vallis]USZ75918.1 hypothetical protein NGM07_01025 [Halorussus vallis]
MVSNSDSSPRPSDTETRTETATMTDGGATAEFDEAALYGVVREAVEDAILGVIGTLLLVGVSLAVTWGGATVLMRATNLLGMALGAGVALFGLYLGAVILELVPPVREWF